ncbi:ATP-binding protein [Actinobaculum sp. 313]|uniref:sensor histidine kinase n=1 Tax=Actinobaculum sp. 313 TaxID=2495645 RepID=UPI000F73D4C9|nr:ATP-binding protein [Actinobaculum sp. 313]
MEAASRATTLEMRRMVHVLRGDETPLAPLPGIERISELVSGARQAGLRVTFSGEGVHAHSDGVSVAVYRIVQEALGNVARHVGPASVDVRLRQEEGFITVTVHDDGGQRSTAHREAGESVGEEDVRRGAVCEEHEECGAVSRDFRFAQRSTRDEALRGGHGARRDDSPWRAEGEPLPGGHGLRGLAERVEALGGDFLTQREQSGLTVWARIPDPVAMEAS